MTQGKKWLVVGLGFWMTVSYNGCSENGFESKGVQSLSSNNGSSRSDTLSPEPTNESPSPDDPNDPPVVINPPNPTPTPDPTPQPSPQAQPAFMVTGHWQSSMYSCDGGMTWKGYRSLDNNFRCWSAAHGNVDCDHASSSNFGLAYGPLGFIASFGWGQPGPVRSTLNGDQWSTVHSGETWAGIAYGRDTYILNSRTPLRSENLTTWQRGGDINFNVWNARRIFYVPLNSGVFISTAESGDTQDLMISTDAGVSWRRPNGLPTNCGNGVVAYDNSRILLLSKSLCRSTDGGLTWQEMNVRPNGDKIIYGGGEFKVYGNGRAYRSVDGNGWVPTDLQVNGSNTYLDFEVVAYHPQTQKYVAIQQGWGRWYEQTQYYRSDDGVRWTLLNKASSAPVAPHPVRQIAVGYLENCQ